MAGFLFKAKVFHQTVQALRPVIERPLGSKPWTYRFLSNNFVAGFVVGTVATMEVVYNGRLTDAQRHDVWVMVYRKFGQSPPFDVEGLRQRRDPAFEQGFTNAETFFCFVALKTIPFPDGHSIETLRAALFTDALRKWFDEE